MQPGLGSWGPATVSWRPVLLEPPFPSEAAPGAPAALMAACGQGTEGEEV